MSGRALRHAPTRTITIERSVRASLEVVWRLWTTVEGFESWWGPEGFVTRVRKFELRSGGEFEFEMEVVDPVQRRGMVAAGMPLTSVGHGRFTDVVLHRRLAWVTIVDFVPDTESYEIATSVELHEENGRVRMVLASETMHNEEWTRLATTGFTGQFERLARVLGGSSAVP